MYVGATWNKRKTLVENILCKVGQSEDRDEIKSLLINFPSPGLYDSSINLRDPHLYAKLFSRPSIVLPYGVFVLVSIFFLLVKHSGDINMPT